MHPIDHPQQNAHAGIVEGSVSKKACESSSIKRLQDLLLEDQSDSHSLYSGTSEYADDGSEVISKKSTSFFIYNF